MFHCYDTRTAIIQLTRDDRAVTCADARVQTCVVMRAPARINHVRSAGRKQVLTRFERISCESQLAIALRYLRLRFMNCGGFSLLSNFYEMIELRKHPMDCFGLDRQKSQRTATRQSGFEIFAHLMRKNNDR